MAYLIDHPPAVTQWYKTRRKTGVSGDPLTGCTVLHTAEGVLDTIGPDTGAENTAAFIQRRTTAGSYHDLVDSDSVIHLIPYEHGAFHDGTGSNNWALSISFACATSDWRRMDAATLDGFLRNGARAFAEQQAWRKAHGFPLTELRLISKAQSDRGESGFTYHGFRDPGRRSDPGVNAPNVFPFEQFMDYCRAALAGTLTAQEDDPFMALTDDEQRRILKFADEVGYLFGTVKESTDMIPAMANAVGEVRWGVLDEQQGLRVGLSGLYALVGQLHETGGIDAAQLAAMIPDAIASDVVDKLSERMAS